MEKRTLPVQPHLVSLPPRPPQQPPPPPSPRLPPPPPTPPQPRRNLLQHCSKPLRLRAPHLVHQSCRYRQPSGGVRTRPLWMALPARVIQSSPMSGRRRLRSASWPPLNPRTRQSSTDTSRRRGRPPGMPRLRLRREEEEREEDHGGVGRGEDVGGEHRGGEETHSHRRPHRRRSRSQRLRYTTRTGLCARRVALAREEERAGTRTGGLL